MMKVIEKLDKNEKNYILGMWVSQKDDFIQRKKKIKVWFWTDD
jgi:hypothetical protein